MDASHFHLVITDRNSHVRELLFRELLREGYRVTEAKDGVHLLEILQGPQAVDLLVLDPDVPKLPALAHITPCATRVVLHTLADADDAPLPAGLPSVAGRVKKNGDLDELKRMVRELLTPAGSMGANHV